MNTYATHAGIALVFADFVSYKK